MYDHTLNQLTVVSRIIVLCTVVTPMDHALMLLAWVTVRRGFIHANFVPWPREVFLANPLWTLAIC